MTTKADSNSSKNLFCRDTYWKLINNHYGRDVFSNYPGARLRNCTYCEKCRGAHSESEIKTLPHIENFNKMDKSKIDLVSIYLNIRDVFEKEKVKVINKDFKKKLSNYLDLNLVELLNLWFDITCYHRKIKKEMTIDPKFKSEFNNISSIPYFGLEEEDLVWSLERITKLCSVNQELIRKINSDSEKPNIWDMCLASVNCKLGCHNISNMLCTDDLLNGKCSCLSLEEFESKKKDLFQQIKDLEKELEDEYLNKKKKKSISRKINSLTSEVYGMSRKIHFTEKGLIPFSKQFEIYNTKKEEINQKEREREDSLKTVIKKKIVKPKL